METARIAIGRLDEIEDPGCREFTIGEGDWPFRGFVVRRGGQVYAYKNLCSHVGHPLNWLPDDFLTRERDAIVCASHGAVYEIETGACRGGPCRGKALNRVAAEVVDGTVWVTGPVSLRG